jgi:hypothetical protein
LTIGGIDRAAVEKMFSLDELADAAQVFDNCYGSGEGGNESSSAGTPSPGGRVLSEGDVLDVVGYMAVEAVYVKDTEIEWYFTPRKRKRLEQSQTGSWSWSNIPEQCDIDGVLKQCNPLPRSKLNHIPAEEHFAVQCLALDRRLTETVDSPWKASAPVWITEGWVSLEAFASSFFETGWEDYHILYGTYQSFIPIAVWKYDDIRQVVSKLNNVAERLIFDVGGIPEGGQREESMPDALFMKAVGGYSDAVANQVAPLPFVQMDAAEVCVPCNSAGGGDGMYKGEVGDGKCASKCDGSMYAFPGSITGNDCFCRVGYYRDTTKLSVDDKRLVTQKDGRIDTIIQEVTPCGPRNTPTTSRTCPPEMQLAVEACIIGTKSCFEGTCGTCKYQTPGWNFKKMACIPCGEDNDAEVQEAGQAVKVPAQFDQIFCPGLTYPIALDENYMLPVHLYPLETRRFSGMGKTVMMFQHELLIDECDLEGGRLNDNTLVTVCNFHRWIALKACIMKLNEQFYEDPNINAPRYWPNFFDDEGLFDSLEQWERGSQYSRPLSLQWCITNVDSMTLDLQDIRDDELNSFTGTPLPESSSVALMLATCADPVQLGICDEDEECAAEPVCTSSSRAQEQTNFVYNKAYGRQFDNFGMMPGDMWTPLTQNIWNEPDDGVPPSVLERFLQYGGIILSPPEGIPEDFQEYGEFVFPSKTNTDFYSHVDHCVG